MVVARLSNSRSIVPLRPNHSQQARDMRSHCSGVVSCTSRGTSSRRWAQRKCTPSCSGSG